MRRPLAVTLAAFLTVGCGVKIPPLDCRTLGCPSGRACVGAADGGWQCFPVTPPNPCKPSPCDPAETCVPLPSGAECRPPDPVCKEGEICGCWVKRPGEAWTKLPDCPPPTPTCPATCPEGQHCVDPEKGCVPKPSDPPKPGKCLYETPSARQLQAEGKNPSINVHRQGAMAVSGTPVANFGAAYYCAIGWAEACAEGKVRGPVAPDGDPNRLACEGQFLEAPCPTFSMAECTGTGAQCPITFDPYICLPGGDPKCVNQNHPSNVAAGCRESTWIRDAGKVVKGEFWWATWSS